MAEVSKVSPNRPLSSQEEMEGVLKVLESRLNTGSLGPKPVESLPNKEALTLFYVNAADSWVCGPAAVGLATIAATAAVAAATVGAVATLAAAKKTSMHISPLSLSGNEDVARYNVAQLLAQRESLLV